MPDEPKRQLICVADDDEAVLDSLRLLLESHGFHVSCFASGEELLAALDSSTRIPICAIVDVRLPGLSGLELHRLLHQRHREIPVIIITGHGDIDMAVRALKAGAFDFVEKPFNEARLLESVTSIEASSTRRRAAAESTAALVAARADLSQRQGQVMDLVTEGLANKEIAARLGISPRTVEIYRAKVMEKMGARNLSELVRMALALEKDRDIR